MRNDVDVKRSFDIIRTQIEDIFTTHYTCAKWNRWSIEKQRPERILSRKSTRVLYNDRHIADFASNFIRSTMNFVGISTRKIDRWGSRTRKQSEPLTWCRLSLPPCWCVYRYSRATDRSSHFPLHRCPRGTEMLCIWRTRRPRLGQAHLPTQWSERFDLGWTFSAWERSRKQWHEWI